MAGLFGFGKTKYVDEPDQNPEEATQNKEAFFLDADEAKTLGNIEFMRKPNTIKRSFPKIRGSQGKKVVSQISSMEMKTVNNNGVIKPDGTESESKAGDESKEEITSRRATDSSMDMFRQMAKDLKK